MEHWTQERYDAFRRELYAQQEEAYRQFHTKLLRSDLPVIGLRAPLLRKIAAEIAKEDGAGFLRICGRETYEERLLYGLVAAALPVSYAEFLPYCDTYTETIVENWAHCDGFCASLKKRIDAVQSEQYYVRMGQAWLLATAWAKDRDTCRAYLSHHHLDAWVFRKFIQKACESYRVSEEDKAYLRSLRKK